MDPEEATRTVGNPEYMQAGYEAQLRSIVMLKNNDGCLPQAPKSRVYLPKRHYPAMTGFWGEKYEEHTDYPIRRDLVERYFTVVDDPAEADFALVDIDEPMGGFGYSRADVAASNTVLILPPAHDNRALPAVTPRNSLPTAAIAVRRSPHTTRPTSTSYTKRDA